MSEILARNCHANGSRRPRGGLVSATLTAAELSKNLAADLSSQPVLAVRCGESEKDSPFFSLTRSGRTRESAAARAQQFVHLRFGRLFLGGKGRLLYCSPCRPSTRFLPIFFFLPRAQMEMTGFEPVTSGLQNRRSPTELHPRVACPSADSCRADRVQLRRSQPSTDQHARIGCGCTWIRTKDLSFIRAAL